MRLGPVLKSGLAFTLAFGASALRANAEIMLRSAMRQQGLVIHHYNDIFNRTRRMHAALDSLRAANSKARAKVVHNTTAASHSGTSTMVPPGHRTFSP